MNRDDLEAECNQYHENMFSWVMELCAGDSVTDDEFIAAIEPDQLDSLIITAACSSPGRFCETWFTNKPEFSKYPEATRDPWRFYPEQWEAIEYGGDLLISGGAGTGKTRMFSGLVLYTLICTHGSVLVITNSSTSQVQIFDECDFQIRNSTFLSNYISADCVTRGNVRQITTRYNRHGKALFLIAGNGETIYGAQIGRNGLVLCDEAALFNKRVWPIIASRGRWGFRLVIGSVPYGAPGNGFDTRWDKGIPLRNIEGLGSFRSVDFACVRFDKETQPDFDETEKKKAVRNYGPPEGARYKVYINGIRSHLEGQVFTDKQVRASGCHIPLYRKLVVIWDSKVEMFYTKKMDTVGTTERPELTTVEKGSYSLADFDFYAWLKRNIPSVPADVGGVDAGRIQDVHVLIAAEDTGNGLRVRWSLESLFMPYVWQAKLLAKMSRDGGIFSYGIGIEATGANIASSVWEAYRYTFKGKRNMLSPYSWSGPQVVVGEKGAAASGGSGSVKRTLKHHLTLRMQAMMDNQAAGITGSLELPMADPELMEELRTHGAKIGTSGTVVYDEEKDHRIEAIRVLIGRYLEKRGDRELARLSKMATERLTLPRERRALGNK